MARTIDIKTDLGHGKHGAKMCAPKKKPAKKAKAPGSNAKSAAAKLADLVTLQIQSVWELKDELLLCLNSPNQLVFRKKTIPGPGGEEVHFVAELDGEEIWRL